MNETTPYDILSGIADPILRIMNKRNIKVVNHKSKHPAHISIELFDYELLTINNIDYNSIFITLDYFDQNTIRVRIDAIVDNFQDEGVDVLVNKNYHIFDDIPDIILSTIFQDYKRNLLIDQILYPR